MLSCDILWFLHAVAVSGLVAGLYLRWRRCNSVDAMTRFSQLGPEFDNFLFAPIGGGQQRNAAQRPFSPGAIGYRPVARGCQIIRAAGGSCNPEIGITDRSTTRRIVGVSRPATVAARLVALLPRPANPNIPSRATLFGAGAVPHPQAIMCVCVIFMVLALGAQWIAANRLPAAQVGNIHAPASSTISAQVRPPISGQ